MQARNLPCLLTVCISNPLTRRCYQHYARQRRQGNSNLHAGDVLVGEVHGGIGPQRSVVTLVIKV
jgi:hypothetical protein